MQQDHPNPMPLSIVIIGAGIAGLTAALALRQEGHHCTLLEKSQFLQETGAAIHLGANVSGILLELGYDAELHGANTCARMIRRGTDGNILVDIDLEKITKTWKEKWLLSHRVDLHDGLKVTALDAQGKGPVPELHLGCNIVKIDSNEGIVELDDGRKFVADVIVGADGNKSITRLEIKPDAQLVPYGKTCYRWLVDISTLRNDPETAYLFENDGCYGELYGKDKRIVCYPCRKNTTLNFVAFVPDSEIEEHKELNNKVLVEHSFSEFFESARKVLTYADEDMKSWKLWDMEQIPLWHKAKLVLIGDAAHPYLPFMGMGGSMAIEDAICIAAVLPLGTSASDVPERLKLYQDIRQERANFIQYASRVNGSDEKPKDFDFFTALYAAHNFDEAENSKQKLQQWLQSRAPRVG
ncbi:fad-dependent monooxygenase ops4 [Acrodontium crateriforme]|uniref:Fad-dependent monooxygenase ops4 n=1 Tax=Acrodontium crateriforme TaxID=150365 RepID=A0AAQ3LZ97_9PEZI|nr:fad-dependent monooxygenase ops4 [Acrodontium crateriforme]